MRSFSHVSRIQSFLLPQWKWYVKHGSVGNRIWIAWDDNFIDMDVTDMGVQYIHCRLTIRALHETVVITVVFGANEVANQCELWSSLGMLATPSVDTPWLVVGDINAVRDHSGVCDILGNIRMAIEEFNVFWTLGCSNFPCRENGTHGTTV
ncbi:UNVERIFIED_CONTAM: hypothetical protein Sindi_1856600, partial [Sesamum indicum]